MNYRLNPKYSVVLMSQRKNAPYNDTIYDDGITIEYEGHNVPKEENADDPKNIDQPYNTKNGKLTQNGLFANSVEEYKTGKKPSEIVRVYEKLFDGIWSEKGFFKLIDYRYEKIDNIRKVFRFILEETEIDNFDGELKENILRPRSRIIPSLIKKQVWERDDGSCVICGAKDELHFDHDLPFSKGGTSISIDNVRILCARHNLAKSDKIE